MSADGQVTLRGKVPSESTRKLVAILVRLEPGVRKVQNELVVTGVLQALPNASHFRFDFLVSLATHPESDASV